MADAWPFRPFLFRDLPKIPQILPHPRRSLLSPTFFQALSSVLPLSGLSPYLSCLRLVQPVFFVFSKTLPLLST
ncbi:uncharacterized protein QC761_0018770 [Podospora bellae-mahoneyi]|uniref:Uncharacterized protein n=1 Tax=Podospora bellae-mahoneyi TaxID=2093777 RepID=A0ABR0G0D2_9PEZI|nr:hypothetical protein QC761_0018770 [Podospora bellae-mahoneyi]